MLAFSCRFWPRQLFDVVCTDCFIPEFWCTRYPVPEQAHGSSVEQQQQPAGSPRSPAASAPALEPRQKQARPAAGPLFSAEPDLPTALQQPGSQGLAEVSTQPRDRASDLPEADQSSSPEQDGSGLHGLVGFVCGRKADAAAVLGHQGIITRSLQQLDAMYGEQPCLEQPPRACSCPF